MKLIKTMCLALASTLLYCVEATPPLYGHGGTNNYIGIGIIVTNETMNSALRMHNARYHNVEDFEGCLAYRWNASGQYWEGSSYEKDFETWWPNWTLTPGDGIALYFNRNIGSDECVLPDHTNLNIQHQNCRYIHQTGTFFTGSKNITIFPGWNFLCQPHDDYVLGNAATPGTMNLNAIDGDKIGLGDVNWDAEYSPCAGYFGKVMVLNTTEQRWDYEWDPPYYLPGTNGPNLNLSSGFWFYNNSGINRTWTVTFTGPE